MKPTCVALSEAALNYQPTNSSSKLLSKRLEDLLTLLREVHETRPKDFNPKLAEYVFFPLSHVLRQAQAAPAKVLQSTLSCLAILLKFGWQAGIAPNLAVQLLVLLSLLAGSKTDDAKRQNITDELQVEAFSCLHLVLRFMLMSSTGKSALLDASNIPTVGRMITVALEGLTQTHSSTVNLAALRVLRTFVNGVGDREVLASFLPGITSSLTQVLTPSTKSRRSFKVLQLALQILTHLLHQILADEYDFADNSNSDTVTERPNSFVVALDTAWLTATAAQIKLALANIVRLRNHDRQEVRIALQRLCTVVLEDLQVHLSSSIPLTIDTYIALSLYGDDDLALPRLQQILCESPAVAETIRSGLYDRFMSLPRIMLSNDESEKSRMSGYMKTSLRLLGGANISLASSSPLMFSSLRDGLTSMVDTSGQKAIMQAQDSQPPLPAASQLSQSPIESDRFFPRILTTGKAEDENAQLVYSLVSELSSTDGALDMVRDSLDETRNASFHTRLTNFWLCLNILRNRAQAQSAVENFLEISSVSDRELDLRESLFDMALNTLIQSTETDGFDWRLQALAIEALALHATTLGKDFRPELADTLYPILHMLGSPIAPLQKHAVICLDIIAKACAYIHAQDLIIANADYLVNGISMKLNVFDVSPEAPQVLLMLVKLCGPSLLPYLDDVVDNIFDALEHFHGYPSLVLLLFGVLKAMVEVGVGAPALTVAAGGDGGRTFPDITHSTPLTMASVVEQVKRRASSVQQENEVTDDKLPAATPHKPWADLQSQQSDNAAQTPEANSPSPTSNADPTSPTPAPLSRTYTLLHRLSTLTQYHLPSTSPHIRTLLLSLLTTSLPYLALHEDTFLPLIHTLWPVLVPRLSDPEAFVVSGVLDVMGVMCEGAGDFVRGRVGDVWGVVRGVWRLVQHMQDGGVEVRRRKMVGRGGGSGGSSKRSPRLLTTSDELSHIAGPSIAPTISSTANKDQALTPISTTLSAAQTPDESTSTNTAYTPTTLKMIRQALERFLISLVRHVHVSATIFDEILTEMLLGALVDEGRSDVREALEAANADAVWLALERARWRNGGEVGKARFGTRPVDVEGGVCFVF